MYCEKDRKKYLRNYLQNLQIKQNWIASLELLPMISFTISSPKCVQSDHPEVTIYRNHEKSEYTKY